MTDSNVYLPASSQFPVVRPEKLYLLTNKVSDKEGLYSLSIPKPNLIQPGIKVRFYSDDKTLLGLGYVTRVDNSVVYCKPFSLLSSYPLMVEFLRGWSIELGETSHLYDPTIFVAPNSEFSTLSAYCSFSGTHEPGLIRWSLFYLEEGVYNRVIDGNDAETMGLCSYRHSGRWRSGSYELRVERYSTQSSVLLSSDTQNWTLLSPSNRLSCGGYSDPFPLLIL